ncbi:hypothetical protein PMAYCL1PPCAC_08816 [Pristionchus mayeri]|uniref:Uncharacterized protein n=1 Tax=Pristionchus mayeri TaxID=1317129 RepID=A0AAN4ZGH6_9BILA|nr:hypothetical protein PMAYCL1PPCAC_08816 [Pristionchus mayeri]
MPEVIALASKSKRLLISLRNEDCDFSITKDRTTLMFETPGKGAISSIHLQLSTDHRKLIQSYKVPCHVNGRLNSIRVDAIYPTVFGDSEKIDYILTGYDSERIIDFF